MNISQFAQVSTGVTLRENNLKELEGARIMDSQGVLVGNRAALLARPELLAIVHELIERFEAHLTAGTCVRRQGLGFSISGCAGACAGLRVSVRD
jgi:hypothetical protein